MPSEARHRFLADSCPGDETLRQEVASLLAAHAAADREFLGDDPVARLIQGSSVQARSVQGGEEPFEPPPRIEPWCVLGELGRGGMGVVYDARRDDGQFDQSAALKLARHGLDRADYLEYFLRERQILARMDHPGIARLLDGGVTAEGRPWFALERIDGTHLTEYCTAKSLGIDERLDLFVEVCAAVEYAHRSLVVHRDLKPSNMLVNAEGRVKLLDFGIAKILQHSGEDAGGPRAGTRPFGTPGYSAPEIGLGGAITTATDVYSLGIVLREMLAGAKADDEPSRRRRGPFDRARSRQDLDRDLAAIVTKATQVEPQERYVSAEALREDIERYLRSEPVRARADSLRYRTKKFLKRHRGSVMASSLALVSLVGGLGAALWQADVAAHERDIAREETEQLAHVKEFLVNLFLVTEPSDQASDLTAETLLERSLQRVRSGLDDRPDLRAELLTTVGDISASVGNFEEARALFTEALSIDLGPGDRNQLRIAASLNGLGVVASHLGDFEHAIRYHRQTLALRQQFAPADSLELAQTYNNLGVALAQQRKLPEAIEVYRRALAIQEQVAGPDANPTLSTMGNLGAAYRHHGDLREAERLLSRVIERMTATGRASHPDMVGHFSHLGSIQSRLGHLQAAARLKRQSYELSREYWGESHPSTRIEMNNYALAAHDLGRSQEAAALMRRTLALDLEQFGDEHPFVAIDRDNLARILLELGHIDEALDHFARAAALHHESSSPWTLAVHQVRHASAQLAAGQLEAARLLVDQGLAAQRQREPPSDRRLTTALLSSASIRTALGDLPEAEALLHEALEWIEKRDLPHHPDVGLAHFGLGELALRRGHLAKARAALERASTAWAIALPNRHWLRAEVQVALGECAVREGQIDRGHRLMDQAIDRLSRDRGPEHWRTRQAIERRRTLRSE